MGPRGWKYTLSRDFGKKYEAPRQKKIKIFQKILIHIIWLRLFYSALFGACPGQLLVYAICKDGCPENRGKKVALVSPATENCVCKKKSDLFARSGVFFITLTLEDFSAPIF